MKSTIGVYDLDASTYCKVRVSTNGVDWTDFAPFPCLTTGDINPPCERFSYNPQSVAVDITSAAAMQPTVYLQFQWQGGWEYYWAIDDLQLSAYPDHDLVMDYGYLSQVAGGYEYGRIPMDQMPATVNVGAEVTNFGLMEQTNVTVHVSLLDPGMNEIGSATTTIPLMAQGDTIVTNELITLPAIPIVGTYTAHFTMTSDQSDQEENPANNEAYRYFAVTLDQYGLDGIGIVPDSVLSVTAVGTTSFQDNTQDVRALTYYEIPEQRVFLGVEVVLGASTQAGSYFIAAVYDTADIQVGQVPAAMVESDPRVITQQDLDNGRRASIAFIEPIVLGPGAYYVSANLYQEGGQNISIADDVTVPQPGEASLIYIPIDDQNRFVYSNGNAWAVRLAEWYRPSVVGELEEAIGMSLSPNPTTGLLHIRTQTSGNMTVEIFNAMGAKVRSVRFTGISTTVDLTGNAAGIYTVRISDGKNTGARRIALR